MFWYILINLVIVCKTMMRMSLSSNWCKPSYDLHNILTVEKEIYTLTKNNQWNFSCTHGFVRILYSNFNILYYPFVHKFIRKTSHLQSHRGIYCLKHQRVIPKRMHQPIFYKLPFERVVSQGLQKVCWSLLLVHHNLMNDQNYCVDKVPHLLLKNMRWNTK